MQRRYAFLSAGFLTTLAVILALLLVNGNRDAAAESLTETLPAQPAAADGAGTQDALTAWDAAWQQQLTTAQQAIADQDALYQPQVTQLRDDLATLEIYMADKLQIHEDAQAQIAQMQAAMEQDALNYQQELGLLQTTHTQLRQDLDTTLAELQAAYDEIAQRQATAPSGGSSGYSDDDHDDDDHGDHDDHDGDHDDDHDEHEDHKGREHDDDD